ncbi:MAG TPA: hypothetical protein VIV40_10305 [Kofleriaceae bacterium]
MALLALALATTGCKKKENKPAENAGSGSAMVGSDMGSGSAGSGSDMAGSGSAMAGSGSDMAGSGSGAAAGSGDAMKMTKKAGNCPSTVLGSTTKADVKGKDVVVMITATDKDAIAAIQKRTDELLKEKKDGAGSDAGGHDQKGTHGGGTGICPVHVPDGATAKMKKEKNGASVTITPKDKPDELKKDIDERIAKADAWVKDNIKPGEKGNQGGVGGLKGEHGANHSGEGDSKGVERKKTEAGSGGGKGTGGGGGKGTGGGSGSGSATKK